MKKEDILAELAEVDDYKFYAVRFGYRCVRRSFTIYGPRRSRSDADDLCPDEFDEQCERIPPTVLYGFELRSEIENEKYFDAENSSIYHPCWSEND
jgi:hypothetical protein